MFEALEELLNLLFHAAEGYCLFRFYDNFLESRLHSRKWMGPAVVSFYTVMLEILSLVSVPDYEKPGYESFRVIGNMVLLFFFLLIWAAVFYKGTRRMRTFLFMTFLSVHEIAYLLSCTIWQTGYQLLLAFALHHMEKGNLSVDGLMNTVYAGGYGMLLLTCLTSVLLLHIVLKNIAGNFQDREHTIHRKELFFLLAPAMTGLLVCMMLRIIMFIVDQEKTTVLYDRYPVLLVIVPGILLLSLLSVPYGVKVFQDMIDLNKERSDRVILENQICSMQGHMEEMEHIYAGIRSMKHDMQNTFSVMMRLAAGASGTDTEIKNYLSEFRRTFEQLEFRYKTGNALEACRRLHEKEREAGLFIRLSSFQRGNMFFIEVENSYDGEIKKRPRSEFPVTNKTNKEAHGIGLMNIKNAAEKYHGAVDWSVDGQVFILSVMMQNITQKKEMGDLYVH